MLHPNRVAGARDVRRFGPWLAASPSEAAYWLASLTVPWWIAGGWALDLFAGSQSRPHKDLDVGILRKDALPVVACLADWEVFEAKDGVLTRLRAGTQPRAGVFSLWCRPGQETSWALELMLDEAAHGNWVYRRHRQIQCPLDMAIRRSAPKLDQRSRSWLRDCLRMIEPAHPWLPALNSQRLG